MSCTFNIYVLLVAGILAGEASARALLCNKVQTKCVTESDQLTIGDRVGVFTPEGELVAVGKVNAMRGRRRAVKINKRLGRINKGYDIALLQTPESASLTSHYTLYRKPAETSMGIDLAYASMGVGDGSPALEFSAFGQWRSWEGIQLIGRGTYLGVEGEVSRNDDFGGIETQPISISGFGLLGGVGYTFLENKTLSIRSELGLGLMYVKATINGAAELVEDEDFDARVQNSLGFYTRGSLGGLWNLGSTWHIHMAAATSVVHQAVGVSLVGGLLKDIN